jgi:FixJ family two-component response regulator
VNGGPATVFVIDDDESVRKALLRMLRTAGWSACAFATAEEFLQSGGPCPSACLVLDVRMPGMSGLELKRLLDERSLRVPVIFITGCQDEHLREQAVRAGAAGFLTKPFDDQSLLDAVSGALAGG